MLRGFLASYHNCLLSGVPFVDPLPRDLQILDCAMKVTHKMIVKANLDARERFEVGAVVIACAGLLSLGSKTTSDLVGAIAGLVVMKQEGKFGTMKVVYREIVSMRHQVANLIRSRVRQCSLTVADDKAYLDTILASYIDKPAMDLGTERYEDWDGDDGATRLLESVASDQSAGEG